jgi:hypothetical protein
MKNLGRYLNKCWLNSASNPFKKILKANGIELNQGTFGFPNQTVRFFTEDVKKTPDKPTQDQPEKKTKHIYKRKEQNIAQNENLDEIRSETHLFREGFKNGVYMREEITYVSYEWPSEERKAESKGKTEEQIGEKSQTEEKSQNKENK